MATYQERVNRMYGGKPQNSGASYESATGAYYSRRIASLNAKNDSEQVELARAEQKQVAAFARKWQIPPEDVGVVLSRLGDHETFPRSKEALDKRRPQTLESLRIEFKSAEAAHEAMKAAAKITTDLATSIPGLATRANETGAAEDGVLLKTLARYGNHTPEPPVAAK